MNRRRFLKTAGTAAAFFPTLGILNAATPRADTGATEVHPSHLVPVEKNLPDDYLNTLLERGSSEWHRDKSLDMIGMPIGGIAAGQLYLLGDGTLGCWNIFNHVPNTGSGDRCYNNQKQVKPVDQGFALVVEDGGRTTVHTLSREGFSDIAFLGEYPIGKVTYADPDCPIRITLEAFSPFIPLNSEDSGLPATIFHMDLENVSKKPVKAGILGWLENAVCIGSKVGYGRTRTYVSKSSSTVSHSVEPPPKSVRQDLRPVIVFEDFEGSDYGTWSIEGEAFGSSPAKGTLPNQSNVSGFIGAGLVNTYLGGDKTQGTLTSPVFRIERKYINFLVGGGNHEGQTCVNLLVDGNILRSAVGSQNEALQWHSWSVEDLEGKQAQIEIVDRAMGAWGHINVDQIEFADQSAPFERKPLREVPDYGSLALTFLGECSSTEDLSRICALQFPKTTEQRICSNATYPIMKRNIGALLSLMSELAPGQSIRYSSVLSWHFANAPEGRFYATRFQSARHVSRYVAKNCKRLTQQTKLWHDVYYDSTLPYWLLDRLIYTVSNLATETCQWWRNNRFWAFEGVGCCHGTCTHVWNYAHALARLFPSLEKSVREMQDLGIALRDDGMVAFRGEAKGNYAADGQAGTILKCYREHLMSPDNTFLKRNWEKIRRVMDFSILQDENANGLIENSQHNTYDLNFEGANTFVGSLYLAALRATEMMARDMKDLAYAKKVRQIFESGSRLTVERLWNGEYFVQDVDLEKVNGQYGDGCLSDQVFGQGWAHHVGLGYIYPQTCVRGALQSVWKYNWAPDVGPQTSKHVPWRYFANEGEAGLMLCTWPKSQHPGERSVYYRDEVWTGIEYQVAGHMVWEGMLTEALSIVRAIHDRYDPLKRNPYNEVECGDHYARALASWGVFTALAGYEYHGPKGFIAFGPKVTPENFRAAFTAAEGWGTFSQTRSGSMQRNTVEVRLGRLDIKELGLKVPQGWAVDKAQVMINDTPIRTSLTVYEDRVLVSFRRKIQIKDGDVLSILIE